MMKKSEFLSEEMLPQQPETEQVPEEESSGIIEPDEKQDGLDAAGKRPIKPYHQRYYLLFGGDTAPKGLDYAGTKNFLREIGFDGGELRQAREGKHFAEENERPITDDGNKKYCAYCGTPLSGVEYNRLPDGRLRCNVCSNSLVKTKEELQNIYKRVILNLDHFYGAAFDVQVQVELLEERKLKKKLGAALGGVDGSVLILGVAVNKKKNYYVYLENGVPRISLTATLVHELTHIWQYTHWEGKPWMRKDQGIRRLIICEGMAKWAEIQYLYLIGETAVAKREEAFTRAREDEYGIGFNLYADAYPLSREVLSHSETPFIVDECPIG